MKNLILKTIVIIQFILFNHTLFGQTKDSTKIDDYYIDFSVPDIGAFTLLGVKPEQITNPGNAKEFSANLLNIISSGNKITPGLAFDWSPYRSFGRKNITVADYKKYYLIRNLQITFGTISDSFGTKLALGTKWTFIDKSDPLLDQVYASKLNELHHDIFQYKERVKNEFFNINRKKFLVYIDSSRNLQHVVQGDHSLLSLMDPNDSKVLEKESYVLAQEIVNLIDSLIKSKGSEDTLRATEITAIQNLCFELKKIEEVQDEFDQQMLEDFKKAKKQWKQENWNATVITTGIGWVWNSPDSKWAGLKTQVFKSYLNGKFPIGKKAQTTGIVSYSIPKLPSAKNDSTFLSQFFVGSRFLIGNADNRFSFDAGYSFNRASNAGYDKKELALNLGFEFKVSDGIYLEIACGVKGKTSELFESGNILSLGSLKYAINKNRRFDLQ